MAAVLLAPVQAVAQMIDARPADAPRNAPDSFSRLAKELMPAVVNISTRQTVANSSFGEFGRGSPLEEFNEFFGRDQDGFQRVSSLGSGFIIDPAGYVVTNNHVIEKADEIDINLSDGTVLPAEVVGRDAETDLALLKVKSDGPLASVPMGDSDTAQVGDWVIAIGNPFGLGGTVTAGIVSARDRNINVGNYDDFIQTDAAINKGNSGGPLFNLKGEVIGVNTAIYAPSGSSGSVGVGFSVTSNLARDIIRQLRENGEVTRGWLGVRIQGVDADLATNYGLEKAEGVIVTSLTDGGPAEKAGLEVGDLILRFDGRKVRESRDLSRVVASAPIGKPVKVQFMRKAKPGNATVILSRLDDKEQKADETDDAQAPEQELSNILGLTLAVIQDEDRRRHRIPRSLEGVIVDTIEQGSDALGKLEKGDVITEINFAPVTDPADAIALAETASDEGRPVLVQLWRNGTVAFRSIHARRQG